MAEETAGRRLLRLDLGSGPYPREGFQGVDIEDFTDFQHDFDSGLPWDFEDDSVDELWSSHAIEHITASYIPHWVPIEGDPHWNEQCVRAGGQFWRPSGKKQDALFHFFDQAFRVAKPGATFTIVWPSMQNKRSYGDPTHRRFISSDLLPYLSRAGRVILGVGQYRVRCNWVGTVRELVPGDPNETDMDALSRRCNSEWNVGTDTMMTLMADKS